MKISDNDKNLGFYKELVLMLEVRLKSLREKNDVSKSDVETEKLRGRIAETKRLLTTLEGAKE